MRSPILALAVAALATSTHAAEPPAPRVAASEAWCRAAPAGAPTGGCYVTLTASTDDRLLAVETPAASRAEIHAMDMTGGVMRMRRLTEGLALPAGRPVALKPGGLHLMIIGPKTPLAAGGAVRLTLRFAKAGPLTLDAPVRAAAAPGGH